MGDVLALLRVMPVDVSTDMEGLRERLKAAIPKGVRLRGIEIHPVAYGLKCVKVAVQMPDMTEGGADGVQAAFEKLEGVGSVEVTDVGLL